MSENYRMPRNLFDIANHGQVTTINRQRMGHCTEDAAKWGLTYCQADFWAEEVNILFENKLLTLD